MEPACFLCARFLPRVAPAGPLSDSRRPQVSGGVFGASRASCHMAAERDEEGVKNSVMGKEAVHSTICDIWVSEVSVK